jgi:hypothetical protein
LRVITSDTICIAVSFVAKLNGAVRAFATRFAIASAQKHSETVHQYSDK